MKATLYTAYHKPASLIESPSITPIHVGRANAKAPLDRMIGDDTGANISALNRSYCELTALYWAWKNDAESTHIGLMHYRRLLDFDRTFRSPMAEVFPGSLRFDDYCEATEAWLAKNPDIDLVAPVAHRMPMTVRENYVSEHDEADLRFVEDWLAEDSPEYVGDWNAVLNGRELLLANMFLAKREVITPYLDWMFPILDGLFNADIPRKYLSAYNERFIGFMSERLFTVYVRKFLRDHPGAKVHRVNIINLQNTLVFPFMPAAGFNGPENVNVAFSSDRAYLPHAAAMLRTLCDNAAPERQYNLFYLHENIKKRDLELLESVLYGTPNATLYPINVGSAFGDQYRAKHHAPSNATFNRFLLFKLMPDLKRMVYLDVDMVLKGDIADVFDVDMGDYQLAAVPDVIMTRVLATTVVTKDVAVPNLYDYLNRTLGLTDPQINSYFNAGLLVLNFEKMDMERVGKDLLAMVRKTQYFFRDQDILNVYFKESYLRLPAKYNVFNSDLGEYWHVPADNAREALAAKHDPFIIHFAAAHHKPWTHPEVHFAQDYWTALERTPFWLEVLEGTMKYRTLGERLKRGETYKLAIIDGGRWLGRKLPWVQPYLLRFHSYALKKIRKLN